jgi:hypothetical protein
MTEEQTHDRQEPGRTGVAAVDAVLDEVDAAATLPIDEQVAVFDRAHEQLRRALDGRTDEPA